MVTVEESNTLTTQESDIPIIYISSKTDWLPNWPDIWRFRELLYFLVWRSIVVRYKQTIVGISWAVIDPFLTMVVFSIFFGRVVRVPSDDIPYPVFSYSALVPWHLFSTSLGYTAQSVVSDANLLQKVYFPSILLPLSATLSRLVDFVLAFVVLLGMMAAYGFYPAPISILVIPALVLLTIAAVFGVGLWLSAFNVYYRDIRQLVPFIIQLWLFITPVIYPSSLLTERERVLYAINPMVSVVDGFRWVLLGTKSPPPMMFVMSIVTTLIALVSGILVFQRLQRTFVDVV